MKFHTTVLRAGKNNTGIEVPPDIVEALGGGKKPAVTVLLNDYAYRSTIAVMGGKFLIPISAEIRAAAKVAGGDPIDVELSLDTEPREVAIPDDFGAALATKPDAARFFAGLSYSNKRRLVMAIDAAKAADTRARRIEKIVADLAAGKA